MAAFEERKRTTFTVTKFIYNNNNKQGFTPNGTNNEYVRVQKRVQGSDRWKGFVRLLSGKGVRYSYKVNV